MIVCRKCGFRNAAKDIFCGSCGSFLEWTGEKVEQPKISEEFVQQVEQETAAAEVKPKEGLLQRVIQGTNTFIAGPRPAGGDRKSTRLNSSHGGISRMPSSA